MTTIYCTKKLENSGAILITNVEATPGTSPYGDWNAHVINFGRRKHLMMVNNLCYYAIIVECIKKADILQMGKLFAHRLVDQWIIDGVIDETEGLIYLQKLLPVVLVKTNNDKTTIGAMNAHIDSYKAMRDSPYWFGKSTAELNNMLNETPCAAGKYRTKMGFPKTEMRKIVEAAKEG